MLLTLMKSIWMIFSIRLSMTLYLSQCTILFQIDSNERFQNSPKIRNVLVGIVIPNRIEQRKKKLLFLKAYLLFIYVQYNYHNKIATIYFRKKGCAARGRPLEICCWKFYFHISRSNLITSKINKFFSKHSLLYIIYSSGILRSISIEK